jgi:hypothetical protein
MCHDSGGIFGSNQNHENTDGDPSSARKVLGEDGASTCDLGKASGHKMSIPRLQNFKQVPAKRVGGLL